jgi:hypothetical protein
MAPTAILLLRSGFYADWWVAGKGSLRLGSGRVGEWVSDSVDEWAYRETVAGLWGGGKREGQTIERGRSVFPVFGSGYLSTTSW